MRKILAILAVTIVVGALGSGLLLKTAGEWAAAQFYPQPYGDEMVRRYLGEVRAQDWAAASARLERGIPGVDEANLRASWILCTERHGPIIGYEARTKFLAPEQVEATVRFADGTVAPWSLRLSPFGNWKLSAVAPPACRIHP